MICGWCEKEIKTVKDLDYRKWDNGDDLVHKKCNKKIYRLQNDLWNGAF